VRFLLLRRSRVQRSAAISKIQVKRNYVFGHFSANFSRTLLVREYLALLIAECLTVSA
jgi:hypothetical protein